MDSTLGRLFRDSEFGGFDVRQIKSFVTVTLVDSTSGKLTLVTVTLGGFDVRQTLSGYSDFGGFDIRQTLVTVTLVDSTSGKLSWWI